MSVIENDIEDRCPPVTKPENCQAGSAQIENRQLIIATKGAVPNFLLEANSAFMSGNNAEALSLLCEENLDLVRTLIDGQTHRVDLMYMLAKLFGDLGEFDQAEHWYRRIVEHEPNAVAFSLLSHSLIHGRVRVSEGVEWVQRAVELEPDNPLYLDQLARGLFEVGRVEKCVELLEGLVARGEASIEAHSNLLLYAHGVPHLTQSKLLRLHKEWARVHAPAHLARQQHANYPDPDRRLRIGYISSAFFLASCAYNFEPILEGHDRSKVEVFGYGSVADSASEIPRRMISKFDTYRAIKNLDDPAVVELILKDGIDILLTFFAHSDGHRLSVLACKPAPIQVNLYYLNTLGMEQIDYRITDIDFDPPGSEAGYVEELVRLPGGMFCWRPPDNTPPVAPLPALHNGRITFGSFNTHEKMNEYTLSLWAQILALCPDSRMLIKCRAERNPEIRNRIMEQFRRHHIDAERIDIIGYVPMKQHLEMYNRVDISLDTYPYTGHITTEESLFMGVPVITLAGKRWVDRGSLAFLKQMDLECCVASTPEQYIAKAAALAGNRDLLAVLRGTLRERMLSSPLCDVKRLCRELEASYRQMWQKWCVCHA